jgi:hypothetical protein
MLFIFVIVLLSSLPGTTAQLPAVTLSYYWTYKVRAPHAARKVSCNAACVDCWAPRAHAGCQQRAGLIARD